MTPLFSSSCHRLSRRFVLQAAIAALFVPLCSYAQTSAAPAHTNFSGRWRMLKDKSDFGGFAMPDIVVQVIDQRGPTLNIHTIETSGHKTSSADVTYFTDGSIVKNTINGRDAESKAFWDGPALMIRTNTKDSKGEDIVTEDRWELSPDGQTLTRTSHVSTPKGHADMKLISVKEKAGD